MYRTRVRQRALVSARKVHIVVRVNIQCSNLSHSLRNFSGERGIERRDERWRRRRRGLIDPNSWPPGFRFHPTDEELVLYYLKRKICHRRLKLNVIGETDVYKWDPQELPGQSELKTGDRQWYFFTPRDRKYPNGARSNRATPHGYWKATGKDRNITYNSRTVGLKKTLVFYQGRAPTGKRTDWVMHEYTMSEKELQTCKALQDSSYALYKVYKKSGPGPKNGEQYGAHFLEEKWLEEDEPVEDNTAILEQMNSEVSVEDEPVEDNTAILEQTNSEVSVEDFAIYDQCQPQINNLDTVKQIAVEFELQINQSNNDQFAYFLPQFDQLDCSPTPGFSSNITMVAIEEEAHSYMLELSHREAISIQPSVVSHPFLQQLDAQTSFDVAQPASSFFTSCEAPEGTSAPDVSESHPHGNEGENFLEIDDLIGPAPSVSHMANIFEQIDTLDGPDVYFDAAMFLHDMGPIDQGTTSQTFFQSLEVNMVDQSNFQPAGHFGVEDQLWTHDQNCNVLASGEPIQVEYPQNSGAMHVNGPMPLPIEEKQNQVGNEGGERDSWFSSALWTFLDTIPTNPASASENSMINRAFERMSSFGRVQIGSRNTAEFSTGVGTAVRRRTLGGNGSFLFLSILGVLSAIAWVLMIGTVVKVFKTFLGRFISSS